MHIWIYIYCLLAADVVPLWRGFSQLRGMLFEVSWVACFWRLPHDVPPAPLLPCLLQTHML